jgi:hypothetical protein
MSQQAKKYLYYSLDIDNTAATYLSFDIDSNEAWINANMVYSPFTTNKHIQTFINECVYKVKILLKAFGFNNYEIIYKEISEEMKMMINNANTNIVIENEISEVPTLKFNPKNDPAVIDIKDSKLPHQQQQQAIIKQEQSLMIPESKQIIEHIKVFGKSPDFISSSTKKSCTNYIKNIINPAASNETIEKVYEQVRGYFISRSTK